jgi:hypothetical protein
MLDGSMKGWTPPSPERPFTVAQRLLTLVQEHQVQDRHAPPCGTR